MVSDASQNILATLYRNSHDCSADIGNNNFESTNGGPSEPYPVSINYIDSPGAAGSTVYTIYLKVSGGSGTLYDPGVMTLEEIFS
jgi:hypothetical protein